MTESKLTREEVAEAFSNGRFELTYPYLSSEVEWQIVVESNFKGKESVVQNCEQTAAYFRSVTTHFNTSDIIVDSNKVVVCGTAEFLRDGERLSLISACDVYEFSGDDMLIRISSYCIPEQK